jgi:hypothetical protein
MPSSERHSGGCSYVEVRRAALRQAILPDRNGRRTVLASSHRARNAEHCLAKQVTGGKLYLAGGAQLAIAAGAVDDLVKLLKDRSDEVRRITILPGNELMLHWSQIVALQIFTAGK